MTKTLLFLSMLSSSLAFSQEDLLKDIDTIQTNTETSQPAFKALQIVTAQSTKLTAKNEWYMVVAHRFGDISTGFKNFFGLGCFYQIGSNLWPYRQYFFKPFKRNQWENL
ncbi:MAG: DUF5777 family beta-barrel protein [Chryseobacterium sp.]